MENLTPVDPITSSILSKFLQPQAQLGETQAATGAQGASAGLSSAETPGAIARSQTSQIQAQQAGASQGLRQDLHSGLTLSDAMDKYKALGMSANDILNQYLSENKYGFPKESPIQLHGMGVTDSVLGQQGDTGTFADKWNTGSAIDELRLAKNYFKETTAANIAGNVAGVNANSAAYDAARTIVGLHLSSLIPGASGAQKTGQDLLSLLPSSNDIRSYTPDMADAKFNAIEKTLMASKRYQYSDVGIDAPISKQNNNQPNATSTQNEQIQPTGKDIINNLLSDVVNRGKSTLDTALTLGGNSIVNPFATLADADPTGSLRKVFANSGLVPQQTTGDVAKGMLTGAIQSASKDTGIGQNGKLIDLNEAQQNLQQHPGNVAMDAISAVLPFLAPELMGKSGEGATPPAEGNMFANAPGKLQQIFQPGKSKSVVGDMRDSVVQSGQDAGNIKSGDAIASDWAKWGETAKAGNISDADAIDKAVASAQKIYGGKNFTPQQLYDSYQQIENGYSVKGIPKAATNAYIDRASQDILQKHLEDVAPGFQNTTDLFSKIYGTEKGQMAKIVKNLPSNAVKTGLNVAGFGFLRDILGG